MIKAAEGLMYQEKQAYYNGSGNRRKRRQLNQKLEKMLVEKEDMSSFLSVISSNFLGVYVVNLDEDVTRAIYKPSYFADILDSEEGCFSVSLQEYADEYVTEKDRAVFRTFLDYEKLNLKMEQRATVEYIYTKKNGASVRVRILPVENYSDSKKTTLWIFERYEVFRDECGQN